MRCVTRFHGIQPIIVYTHGKGLYACCENVHTLAKKVSTTNTTPHHLFAICCIGVPRILQRRGSQGIRNFPKGAKQGVWGSRGKAPVAVLGLHSQNLKQN